MLQPNQRLGDFQIVRLLGKGGMGEVYEARQLNPDRLVALKVLAPWLANDDDSLSRFKREAEVPGKLDHPGIVRIITTGHEDGRAYYTMHLVRGVNLCELIKRANAGPVSAVPTRVLEGAGTPSVATPEQLPSGSAPPHASYALNVGSSTPLLDEYLTDRFTTAARIGVQAARALAHAHQQGYLHRDIKPSNLMVDHNDHVYLVDFGLTRGLEVATIGTNASIAIGTPWYMSPEQADGMPADERSDIYALGVTLFELVTQGQGPFTGPRQNREAVLAQVRIGQTIPLRTLAPEIPPALEAIILRAMHLNPQERFQDAADLARALQELLDPTQNPSIRPAPPRSRLPRGVLAGGAMVICALLAILIAIPLRNRQASADDDPDKAPPAIKAKFDGSLASPEILRQHPMDLRVSLLKDGTNEPVWKELFHGKGKYNPWPTKLDLVSPPTSPVTILGIADPDRQCFRFTVELGRLVVPNQAEGSNRIGVVFGWRRLPPETDLHPRCFVVELDEYRNAIQGHGFLRVGTARLVQPNALRGGANEWYRELPNGMGRVPLNRSNNWHTLSVEVRGESAEVMVDNLPPVRVSVPNLRTEDKAAALGLDPRGAIGLWSLKGHGYFRNATITLLSGD